MSSFLEKYHQILKIKQSANHVCRDGDIRSIVETSRKPTSFSNCWPCFSSPAFASSDASKNRSRWLKSGKAIFISHGLLRCPEKNLEQIIIVRRLFGTQKAQKNEHAPSLFCFRPHTHTSLIWRADNPKISKNHQKQSKNIKQLYIQNYQKSSEIVNLWHLTSPPATSLRRLWAASSWINFPATEKVPTSVWPLGPKLKEHSYNINYKKSQL